MSGPPPGPPVPFAFPALPTLHPGVFPREHLRRDEQVLFETRPHHTAFLFARAPAAFGWGFFLAFFFSNLFLDVLFAGPSAGLFCLGPIALFLAGFGAMLFYRHLQYRRTAYAITTSRALTTTGVIGRTLVECPHDKVQNVTLRQGILDRLLKTGTLVFATAGLGAGSNPWGSMWGGGRGMFGGGILFQSIPDPGETKRAVDDLLEHVRRVNRAGELREMATVIGASSGKLFCSSCGAKSVPGASHCTQCGRPID